MANDHGLFCADTLSTFKAFPLHGVPYSVLALLMCFRLYLYFSLLYREAIRSLGMKCSEVFVFANLQDAESG